MHLVPGIDDACGTGTWLCCLLLVIISHAGYLEHGTWYSIWLQMISVPVRSLARLLFFYVMLRTAYMGVMYFRTAPKSNVGLEVQKQDIH